MAIAELTQIQKEELAVSLAVLAVHDAKAEISADNLSAALEASGVSVAPYLPALFADLIGRGLKVDKFLAGPSAGTS
jgi:ribosomal protein L12E/L44/L45/RPP1/RPP2